MNTRRQHKYTDVKLQYIVPDSHKVEKEEHWTDMQERTSTQLLNTDWKGNQSSHDDGDVLLEKAQDLSRHAINARNCGEVKTSQASMQGREICKEVAVWTLLSSWLNRLSKSPDWTQKQWDGCEEVGRTNKGLWCSAWWVMSLRLELFRERPQYCVCNVKLFYQIENI